MDDIVTCRNMTCPEACCSGQALRDHGIHHDMDHCCSHESHEDHEEMMKTLVAPFRELAIHKHPFEHLMPEHHHIKPQPTPNENKPSTEILGFPNQHHPDSHRSQPHETFTPHHDATYNQNNYGDTMRSILFPLMASGLVAVFVIALLFVATYYAIKWRKKYLKSKRTSNIVISHNQNSDRVNLGGSSTYWIPNEESLPRNSSSARYTEMVNRSEKVPLPDLEAIDNTRPEPANVLPAYRDLFMDESDAGGATEHTN